MAFAIKDTLVTVEGFLQASGYFQKTQVGEPKSPPREDLSVSVFMANVALDRLFLDGGTGESHVVTVRIYKNMLSEPQENIEYDLAQVISQVTSDFLGDADLGSTIMTIDAGGIYGTAIRVDWGYLDVGGIMYRIADITLPLIVNDSATVSV